MISRKHLKEYLPSHFKGVCGIQKWSGIILNKNRMCNHDRLYEIKYVRCVMCIHKVYNENSSHTPKPKINWSLQIPYEHDGSN